MTVVGTTRAATAPRVAEEGEMEAGVAKILVGSVHPKEIKPLDPRNKYAWLLSVPIAILRGATWVLNKIGGME